MRIQKVVKLLTVEIVANAKSRPLNPPQGDFQKSPCGGFRGRVFMWGLRFIRGRVLRSNVFHQTFAIISAVIILFPSLEAADFKQPPFNANWNLYLPFLKNPANWNSPISFSAACYQSLKNRFDGTSYQVVALENSKFPDSISGKKRDLVIELEPQGTTSRARSSDSLVFWLKFRTCFKYSRIVILTKKELLSTLADSVASAIYLAARTEFFGELNLQGGPGGCTITIPEVLTTSPPCKVQLPYGVYEVVTEYPNFTTRRDSVSIDPGAVVKKRVLLLPVEE
jgi:hypothetical protein